MKTERNYGYEYAEFLFEHGGVTGPADINKMLGATTSIPDEDYLAMQRNGISNPDATEYWRGYNSFFNNIDDENEED